MHAASLAVATATTNALITKALDLGAIASVVFDLDGTLADSRLDFDAMRAETGCPEEQGLLEFVADLADPEARETASAVIHRHEMHGARHATWMPAAQSLCTRLARARVPTGIFTRNSREAALLTINALAIPHDVLVAREDAPPKPDPTGLLRIAEGFGLQPEAILYVGDYLYDLEAATNAGVVSCLYDPEGDSPFAANADLVVSHFDELTSGLLAAGAIGQG